MARFNVRKTHFGDSARDGEDDEGRDLPRPALARLIARRAAGIAEANEALAALPGPCESVHFLATARMDLTDLVNALLERHGPAQLRIATLGYNRRNLKQMLSWLDANRVSTLHLLASQFFRSHNGDLWEETQANLRERHCRCACSRSHAKVLTLAFVTGLRYSIEGSANLCGNGSAREQFALINDAPLHDWHARWIEEAITAHEGSE